ncbi:MAG TPA: glycosyltransferase family 39 protein [Thermoanaerobaculia bacterium]|nr:glycosyltransferase family 39 protein [Thermoanaerobaculia bacterium]
MTPTAARAASAQTPILVFLAALLVKLGVLLSLGSHPLLQPAGDMDGAVYLAMARSGPPPVAYFVSPLYLYFLKLTGPSIYVALTLQIVLGSLGVVLLLATSARWFGRRAALLTAALAILTGVITFNEVTILQSSLDPFLVALSMWLLCRALQENDWRHFAGAGAATALLVLNRPNVLLWIAALGGLLLLGHRWRGTAAFALAFVILLAPVAARNLIVGHELVLVSSHGGLNFYIGNNAAADGAYVAVPGIRPTIAGQSVDARLMAERAAGHALDSRGVSRWFYGRALEWMLARPDDALKLFLRKLAYTIHQTDLSLNFSYDFFSHDVSSPLRFLVVGPWLLVPLGFAGAATLWRDRRFLTWFAFVPVYAVSVAIFFVASRYRLPLLVVLAVAAGGVIHVRRPSQAMAGLLLGVVALWPFGLDSGRSQEQTNMVVSLIERHQFDEADRLIPQFEQTQRDPARLHHRSALAYEATGDNARAASMFEQVLRDPIAQPILRTSATDELAAIYARSGRNDEARKLLAGVDPVSLSAGRAVKLGRLALEVRDGKDAITFLRVAIDLDPTNGAAWYHLGVAFLAEGEPRNAIAALDKARSLMPRYAPTFLFLALAQAQSGNVAEARKDAVEALRLRPAFPQARQLLDQLGR